MEKLIQYFEKKLTLTPADLLLNHDDRQILIGQIDMLEQMKEIAEHGYPDEDTKKVVKK